MTTPDTFSASIRASCSLSAMQLGKLWAQSMTRQLVKDKSKPELMPRGHAWGGGGAGGVEGDCVGLVKDCVGVEGDSDVVT